MSGEPRTLTHSVDIDLVGVAKLKSVSPEPSDQGVINGETTILRFRVQDGERITLDTGRRQFEVVVNRHADTAMFAVYDAPPAITQAELEHLDCLYTFGNTADCGSLCPEDDPCVRCQGDRARAEVAELRAALQGLLDDIADMYYSPRGSEDAIKKAYAALAKARGETP